MAPKLDERTTVPLSWLGVCVALSASVVCTSVMVTARGSYWVQSVNDRLARIETRLGIAKDISTASSENKTDEGRD